MTLKDQNTIIVNGWDTKYFLFLPENQQDINAIEINNNVDG